MSEHDVLPSATRRVKLTFDKNGDPAYPIVTSPECFKQNALGVLPPRDVIPVIFIPGVMGSNLKLKDGSPAWMPPNTILEEISALWDGIMLNPAERQALYDPGNTEVSYEGACKVPDSVYWLTEEEARKRGWGSLHAASYLATLNRLEVSLNDQYTKPGRSEKDGNYLLPEIGAGRFLGESPLRPAPDTESCPANARPDYEELAAKLFEAWGRPEELPVLSEADIKKLADYFYPVYAFGYNWLRSCEDAAQELLKRIDEITARYQTGYFRCEDKKVILVSHSLGGHVARRAAPRNSPRTRYWASCTGSGRSWGRPLYTGVSGPGRNTAPSTSANGVLPRSSATRRRRSPRSFRARRGRWNWLRANSIRRAG
jgi:hypothetical protein